MSIVTGCAGEKKDPEVDLGAPQSEVVFAGHVFAVRAPSDEPSAPGPNYWSNGTDSVFVDQEGRLHMQLLKSGERWHAVEVYLAQSHGYGRYEFTVDSPVDGLDPNVVFGFFTWDSGAPREHYREIDIEFARWGQGTATNAQFVVQPHETSGNMHRYQLPVSPGATVHAFEWTPDAVRFTSSDSEVWTYTGSDIPSSGHERLHMNLWLHQGAAPQNDKSVELVISKFLFEPLP